MKKANEDEGLFSESSEEELLADSPKLQRANAKRFGKVSCVLPQYAIILRSSLFEVNFFTSQNHNISSPLTFSFIPGKTKYRDAR